MADEKKSTSPSSGTSAPSKPAEASSSGGQNGKGDAPRNCFSDSYRSNFDRINWGR